MKPNGKSALGGDLPDPGTVLVRVSALSVAQATRVIHDGDYLDDYLIANAIRTAASGELLDPAKQQGREGAAARRYVARMGGRCTPFGLMAGVSSVSTGNSTSLRSPGRDGYQARVFLDSAVLESVVNLAVRDADRRLIPFRPNPTLRRAGQYFYLRDQEDHHSEVTQVKATRAIAWVLDACRDGASHAALAAALEQELPGTAPGQLDRFVAGLAECGLIVPDLGVLRAGVSLDRAAVALLRRLCATHAADAVERAVTQLERPRRLTTAFPRELERAWRELSSGVPSLGDVPWPRRFNIDLEPAVSGTVDRRTVMDLAMAAMRLETWFKPSDPLQKFREAFERRYGDADVPLLEAADPEHGVLEWPGRTRSGIAEASGIMLPQPHDARQVNPIEVEAYDHWAATGEPFDLATLPMPSSRATVSILASLLDDTAQEFRSVLVLANSQSPGTLTGRFSLHRPEGAALMRKIIVETCENQRADDGSVPISAEIMYSPRKGSTNVLTRPQCCDETIALHGATGGTFHASRLLLQLNNGRFTLYDRETGRQVLLFLNSAHNAHASHNDPLYVLLSQLAGRPGFRWRWHTLNRIRHLPRVVSGSVIVAPENWRITGAQAEEVLGAARPSAALRSVLTGIGARRWIGYVRADQILPIDLEHEPQLTEMLRYIIRRGEIMLTELPHVEYPAVAGPTGRHAAEICVSLPAELPPVRCVRTQAGAADRRDWVYLKYFCGLATAEDVIKRSMRQITACCDTGFADCGFYVRYNEDGNHVRVRVRPCAAAQRPQVLAAVEALTDELVRDRLVGRVQRDVYVPEVARYGGPEGLMLAERLFFADSSDVADLLAREASEQSRLTAAARDVFVWWQLGYGGDIDIVRVMRGAQDGICLGRGRNYKDVGRVHRDYRALLNARFAENPAAPRAHGELVKLMEYVRDRWGFRRQIDVLTSVVHMHCNRMFTRDERRMEALAYEFAIRRTLELRSRARPA